MSVSSVRRAVVSAAVLSTFASAVATVAAQPSRPYRKLVGETRRVCGEVVSFSFEGADSCHLRLDLGTPSVNPSFYILIPERLLSLFETPPESRFHRQNVCVVGLVREQKKVPYIEVEQVSQLSSETVGPPAAFGVGARRPCERGVEMPRLRREVKPDYPSRELIARGLEDELLLEVVVGAEGLVAEVRTLYSQVKEFEPAAVKAISQWRFDPGTFEGRPVPVIVSVHMTFKLRR